MTENELGKIIIGESIDIHKNLGPGLLESVYEIVLYHALLKNGMKVLRQVPISINYDGLRFDEAFRADLIVENKVIVELKSVQSVQPVHKKQLLTYLRLTNLKLGYLINFNEELLKDGITRIINGQL